MNFGQRLRKHLIMPFDNPKRSSFAESAYAHASRSSPSRQSHQESDDLLCYDAVYEDYTVRDSAPAEFHPLAGASVVIILNTSKNDKVTDARTLRLMEERESLGCAVQSLGGVWISNLEYSKKNGTTHAIWIASDRDGEQISSLTDETLDKLNICLAMDIPVVNPSWLTQIGFLSPGMHWSEVDVENHVPKIMELFDDFGSGKSSGTSISHGSHQNTAGSQLSSSIGETYKDLIDENPDLIEEEAIQRAVELSMADFAIVRLSPADRFGQKQKPSYKNTSPYEILGIDEGASPAEVKNAYRKRSLQTHPDKGGKPGEFEEVSHAYRVLLNPASSNPLSASYSRDPDEEIPLKSTAHWDTELKEHRNLVKELYQQHGHDINTNLQRQNFTLERLGLRRKEAGSQNYNEKNELIRNSCFYLSLATSYLSGIGALAVWDKADGGDVTNPEDNALLLEADDALIKEMALQLKRIIEAAVLSKHPEWAARGFVGESVQAFSDFLVYILESNSVVSDWAVVVFDTTSGFADVYKGQNYKDEEEGGVDESCAASNTICLRFTPGHYQPLLAATPDSVRPTLKQVISVLDESEVLYVVTDGAAPEASS